MPQATTTIIQGSQKILDLILSPQLQERLLPLKITFIIFFVCFFLLFIYYSRIGSFWSWGKVEAVRTFVSTNPMVFAKKFAKKWRKIKSASAKESPAQRKLAVIKAYQLLDDFLAHSGKTGQSLEEKLSQIENGQISNLEELLAAVNVCQDILRDPDFKLSKEQAKEIARVFGKTFIDLELL